MQRVAAETQTVDPGGDSLDAGDAVAGDELGEVAPVRADVGERARRAAELRVDAPVVVLGRREPVLQVAAMDQPHGTERAGGESIRKRLRTKRAQRGVAGELARRQQLHQSEAPRIVERHHRAIRHLKDDVIVTVRGSPPRAIDGHLVSLSPAPPPSPIPM